MGGVDTVWELKHANNYGNYAKTPWGAYSMRDIQLRYSSDMHPQFTGYSALFLQTFIHIFIHKKAFSLLFSYALCGPCHESYMYKDK